VSPERTSAFAPGRVNLIGEHTDYNEGLALPFAISEGVTVRARIRPPGPDGAERVEAHAAQLGERDEFELAQPAPAEGWRAFVRGTVAELARAGVPLAPSLLEITGEVPLGAGLSSSAALEVALSLAMIGLGARGAAAIPRTDAERIELARLCARVESDWVGARTGLLDQLASIFGAPDTALCIDFRTLEVERVRLELGGWRLTVLDSGERHSHASSGYNERRAECAAACELLGVPSLREADPDAAAGLPEPLNLRVRHVLGENERVRETVAALQADELPAVGRLLNASHASLRDCYAVSTPAVEAAVQLLQRAGAAGARLMGGGFGGSVLGLFAPGVALPAGAREVRPGPGAHLIEDR
jgi:galactokinase